MDSHEDELDSLQIEPKPETSQVDFDEAGLEGIVDTQAIELGEERKSVGILASQEETRAKIALTFTQVFLILVGLAMLGPIVINLAFPTTFGDPVETAKELLTTISSILAGPFGFIVGFYFKKTNE